MMTMTCIVCKGKGWYTYHDYTPEGVMTYRQKCMTCQKDATIDDCRLVRVEGSPSWMEDRETRIASGEPQWQPGGEV